MSFIAWLKGEEPGLLDMWLHSDDTGHFGEYLIDYALKSVPGYAQKLCNIYLPYKGRTSEIDVIMIHETGIYVFESKNYSGWIFGDEKSQYWTQCLNPKTKNRFYNPIMQNKTHIKALLEYLKLESAENIISYIIFSQRCELKKVCQKTENTFVVQRPDMLKSLRSQIEKNPNVFNKEQIDTMYDDLLPLIDVSAEEKEKHIEDIKNSITKQPRQKEIKQVPKPIPVDESLPKLGEPTIENSSPSVLPQVEKICPRCGGKMILRTASKGANKGKQFYGCSNFPKCRGIINL